MIMIVPTVFVTLFFAGVMALSFVNILGIFILIMMVMIGFSAYAMFNVAFSQYVTDNMIAYLYEEQEKIKAKEIEKLNKQKNKEKKKQQQTKAPQYGKKKKKK